MRKHTKQSNTLQTQISHSINWMRSICAYATMVNGIVLCAITFLILFPSKANVNANAFIWLFLAALILWVAWGLVEGNPVSWKIFQAVGAVSLGASGIVCFFYGIQDFGRWLPVASGPVMAGMLLWLLGGVILTCWAIAQIAEQPLAELAWLAASLPCGLALVVLLTRFISYALSSGQTFALIASAISIIVCLAAFRIIVRPKYHIILASLLETDEKLGGGGKRFPTHFHELLARGRLCEVFELPCGESCPLATKVAIQYQQLRLKNQDSPHALEALEKAYSILVTPRARELCGLAHEIMQAHRKRLGERVFKSLEMLLWTKLWNRLQSNEFKGDPQKVKMDMSQLIKKI